MEKPRDYQLVSAAEPAVTTKQSPSLPDVGRRRPFKIVVDPRHAPAIEARSDRADR